MTANCTLTSPSEGDLEAGTPIGQPITQTSSSHDASSTGSQVHLTSAAMDPGVAPASHEEQSSHNEVDDEGLSDVELDNVQIPEEDEVDEESDDDSDDESDEADDESDDQEPRQTISIIHDTRKDAPNLCRNLQYSPSRHDIHIAACVGAMIQVGILVFFGIMVLHPTARDSFKKEGEKVSRKTLGISIAGSCLLSLGVLFCAHVVESSTKEEQYVPNEDTDVYMIWIQRKQTVGDQVFDSYAIFPKEPTSVITTSRRNISSCKIFKKGAIWRAAEKVHKKCFSFLRRHGSQASDAEENGTSPKRSMLHKAARVLADQLRKHAKTIAAHRICKSLEESTVLNAWATAGTFIAMTGFVMQFIGLRAMNSYASLAQLAAIGLMTTWRTWFRRGLANDFFKKKLRPGYELDWLAWEINQRWVCSKSVGEENKSASADNGDDELPLWDEQTEESIPMKNFEPSVAKKAASSESIEDADSSGLDEDSDESHTPLGQWLPVTGQRGFKTSSNSSTSSGFDSSSAASEPKVRDILETRTELGKLVKSQGRVSEEAVNLAQAMELVMDEFFPIRDGSSHDEMVWPTDIVLHDSLSQEGSTIDVKLTPEKPHWQVRADVLQAVLSLWTYSVSGTELGVRKDEAAREDAWMRSAVMPKCLRLFGPEENEQREQLGEDVMWWIPWSDGQMLEVCAHQDGSDSEDDRSVVDVADDKVGNGSGGDGDNSDADNDDDDDEEVDVRSESDSSEIYGSDDDMEDDMYPAYSEYDGSGWEIDSDDNDEGDNETFHWTRVVGRTSREDSQAATDEKDLETFKVYRKGQETMLSDWKHSAARMLAVEMGASLPSLYARDLLFSFITWAVQKLPHPLQDRTEVHGEGTQDRPMNISDSGLTSLAKAFGEPGMGTETEVQLGIITPLSLAGNLPFPGALFDRIRKDIASARRDQKWRDLRGTLGRLNQNVRRWGNHETRIGATATAFFAIHHKLHRDERELRMLFPGWKRSRDTYESLLSGFEEWAKDEPGDLEKIRNLHATTDRYIADGGNKTTGWAAYPPSHRFNTSELHWLSIGGDADGVDDLEKLEEACKRINCKRRDLYGWTPLHYATINSNVPAVSLLLERGAELRQTDLMGYTALHYPRSFLAEAIFKSRDNLHGEKSPHAAELLDDMRSCLSTQGVDGQTPMHKAATSGDVSFVFDLIKILEPKDQDDIFAQAMKEDHLGHTPFHKAALYGQAEALRELAEHKPDNVDKPDAGVYCILL
jgi:hypothetical protein